MIFDLLDHLFQSRDPRFEFGFLLPERFDGSLLLLHSLNQHHIQAVILDAFDLSRRVVGHKQWLDLFDLFGGEAEVTLYALFPGKGNGSQAAEEVQAGGEGPHVGLVAQAR